MPRPPKPTKIKALAGTLRKRPKSNVAETLLLEVPPYPKELVGNRRAQRYFNYYCQDLIDRGLLSVSDIPLLTTMALEQARYFEIEDELKKMKPGDEGYAQLVKVQTLARDYVGKMSKAFGFDPYHRQLIKRHRVEEEEKRKDDEFEF